MTNRSKGNVPKTASRPVDTEIISSFLENQKQQIANDSKRLELEKHDLNKGYEHAKLMIEARS